MIKPLINILLYLAISYGSSAQVDYRYKTYTSNDGLPSSLVETIFQDSRGFLWIGTAAGISRFDGRHFINYEQQDIQGSAASFCEDNKKTLWVAIFNVGLFYLDGCIFKKVNIGNKRFISIEWVNDKLWIATAQGLFTCKNGNVTPAFQNEFKGQYIRRFTSGPDGSLLLCTQHKVYRYSDHLEQIMANDSMYFNAVFADRSGRIWISTVDAEVFCLENNTKKKFQFDKWNHPDHFLEKPNGELVLVGDSAICVYRNGIFRDYIPVRSGESVKKTLFGGIIDHDGNYWLTSIDGLIYISSSKMKIISPVNLPISASFSIPHDSNLYFTSRNQIFQTNSNKDSLFRPALYENVINSVKKSYYKEHFPNAVKTIDETRNGSLLISTNDGSILAYTNGKISNLYNPIDYAYFCSLKEDSCIWFISAVCVLKYENGTIVKIPSNFDQYPFFMKKGAGVTLVGTGKGLYRFEQGMFTKIKLPVPDSLVTIRDMYDCKDGSLLLATSKFGVWRVKIFKDTATLVSTLNASNGLGSNFIEKILDDDNGNIWIASSDGIYKIKDYFVRPQVFHLSTEDGLLKNSWSFTTLSKDNNGNIFVGGSKGLVSFNGNTSFKSFFPVKAYITDVLVNNKTFERSNADSLSSFFGIPSDKVFHYTDNTLTFYFTGIDFYYASRMKFEYVLDHYQKEKQVTNSDNVTFYNLPPGNYTFKVRATTNSEFTNEEYATIQFSIAAPFWRETWFLIFAVIFVSAIIFSTMKWRLYKTNKDRQFKLTIAKELSESKLGAVQSQMNPHFIFNALNSIQHSLISDSIENTYRLLSKFASLIRNILDSSSERLISLEKEVETLQLYLDIESKRLGGSFKFELNTMKNGWNGDVSMIPPMIIQPFVENAIWHGLMQKDGDKKLQVNFTLHSGNSLTCVIEDNGIGREKSAKIALKKNKNHESKGIKNIFDRVKLIEQAYSIIVKITIFDLKDESGVASGTKVIIDLSNIPQK